MNESMIKDKNPADSIRRGNCDSFRPVAFLFWLNGGNTMSMTRGQHFIDSLNDGRCVWLGGHKIESVPEHPAFSGTLSTIAALFDTLDDPTVREQVGFISPKTGKYVHNSFLIPMTHEDLQRRTASFANWIRSTHGVMSRLSEYARSLVTSWYAVRQQFTPEFADKITNYYEFARDNDRFLTTALSDPQIDRSKSPSEQQDPDSVLRIVKRNSEGVFLRGAKMIATAGPYTHDFLVYPFHRLQKDDLVHAHMIIVPANTPGLHILCREPYTSEQPQDHPLSAKYDEMDSVLLFDDAFVPWERVLLYDDPEGVWQLRNNQTAVSLAYHSTIVRLLVKLEFVAGVAFAIAEAIGADKHLHVQEKLGELTVQIETIKALLIASETGAKADVFGTLVPDPVAIETARNLGSRFYPRSIEILQQIGAGGFMQVPASIEEVSGALGGLIRKYFRGANLDPDSRIKLYKLAWDLIGSPLGSRHELYERFYHGDPVRTYASQYLNYNKQPLVEQVWSLIKSL
jgi:4-hydroxyphenylacetate 3-monooxygenase